MYDDKNKDGWNLETTSEWVKNHGYKIFKIELMGHQIRFRVQPKEDFDHYITKQVMGTNPDTHKKMKVYLVIGFYGPKPKDKKH